MYMLCKVSALFGDVSCPSCGQGFLVYWTRQRAGEREQQRSVLENLLREQHTASAFAEAHAPAFQLPDAPINHPRSLPKPLVLPVAVYS